MCGVNQGRCSVKGSVYSNKYGTCDSKLSSRKVESQKHSWELAIAVNLRFGDSLSSSTGDTFLFSENENYESLTLLYSLVKNINLLVLHKC